MSTVSSSTSSTSVSDSSIQPSTSTVDPSLSLSPHAHSDATAAVAGTIGTLCVLATVFLLGLLFWRRRKRRVLREKQMAIRRMTIVGPPPSSSPPSLPYPFSGNGNRSNLFDSTNSSFVDIEMASNKNIGVSRHEEAGLPWTKLPAPAHRHQRDRVIPNREQTPAPPVATDSASVFSSKQSEIGEGDRMVLVNGVYVLALEHESEAIDANRNATPVRMQDRL